MGRAIKKMGTRGGLGSNWKVGRLHTQYCTLIITGAQRNPNMNLLVEGVPRKWSGMMRPLTCSPSAVCSSDARLECATLTVPAYM